MCVCACVCVCVYLAQALLTASGHTQLHLASLGTVACSGGVVQVLLQLLHPRDQLWDAARTHTHTHTHTHTQTHRHTDTHCQKHVARDKCSLTEKGVVSARAAHANSL